MLASGKWAVAPIMGVSLSNYPFLRALSQYWKSLEINAESLCQIGSHE